MQRIPSVESSTPNDAGIDLLAAKSGSERHAGASSPYEPEERIRRIRRGLRPVYRLDLGIETTADKNRLSTEPPPVIASPPAATATRRRQKHGKSAFAWTLSALLAIGSTSLAIGLGCLAWATAHADAAAWQGGMTATIAGEAGLILGLTIMAIRLWQNSRQVNTQLEGVDDQLAEIQYTAGRLAHARQSCSQAYYDHFGAAASPPLALANLRGQLDQIAARINR